MSRQHTRRSLTALFMLMTGIACTAALAQDGDGQNSLVANTVLLDRFDNIPGIWMDAQATYWRREQYADIAPLTGTKAWYAKSGIIDAEMYVEYAEVALVVNDNPKEVRDALAHAKSLLDKSEKNADKAEASKMKDITGTLDSIKGEVPKSPLATPGDTLKTTQDLTALFNSLKEVVEKG